MVLGQLLLLLRRIPEANMQAHRGIWEKQAKGCFEARGKRLGIVGYGHIGTQLGILAEGIGMNVFFYDIENKLPLGNATQVRSLTELLNMSDVVSLHVPETASTKNMFAKEQFDRMKPGLFLLMLHVVLWWIFLHLPRRLKANIYQVQRLTYSQQSQLQITIQMTHCI
ncbi:hypothetical protein MASR2M36_33750 [Providencia sp.]